MTTAPDDERKFETCCASSPMTGVSLPGDSLNIAFKPINRPSGLFKSNSVTGYKPPKFVNVECLNQSAGPLPCSGTISNIVSSAGCDHLSVAEVFDQNSWRVD